ncbi:MAG: hydroxymethylglutaryl-CoA lyase [Bacteroidota bacterium]
MPYPPTVTLHEVGPRDGFQFEATPIPTDEKVAFITALADAGLPRIQVTSFVHPKWVPQMADAEAVVARLPQRAGVIYTGLALNPRGVDRAHAAGLTHVDLSIATNETHSRANANMTVDEGVEAALEMIRRAQGHGLQAQIGLQTVFGYETPGDTPLARILAMVDRFAGLGVESLSLADSTGMANPALIRERVRTVQERLGEVPLVLHLHDTRGLGLANVVAALACGVAWFDTSFGGLGGCPFIPGATGNIATEDTAYLLDSLGIETGVDRTRVAAASQRLAAFLGRELTGKLYRLDA